MDIKFEYAIDQKVITPFARQGIVKMAGFDKGGTCYFVTTDVSSEWYYEHLLMADCQ